MDLSQFATTDYVDVDLAGLRYRVGEMTLRDWAPVQAWIKATVPGPLSALDSPDYQKLPPATRRELQEVALREQRTNWPPRISSREWFLSLDHEGGQATLLRAVLGKHQPSITQEQCETIAAATDFDGIIPVVLAALGHDRPKAGPPSPPATGGNPSGPAATTSATPPTSSPPPGAGAPPTSST